MIAETLAETLAAGFEQRALVTPRSLFVIDGERYVSRAEFDALADRYARALDNLEASRDDVAEADALRAEKAEMAERLEARLDALEDEAARFRDAATDLARDYAGHLANTISPCTAARFYVDDDLGGHLFVTLTNATGALRPDHAEIATIAAKIAARLPRALVTPAFRVTAEYIGPDGISGWSVTAGVRLDDTAEARGGEER